MNRNKIIIKVVAILIITLAGAITAYYYYKNLPEQEEVGEVKSQTEDEIGKELNGILAKEFIGMMEMVRIPAGEVMLGSGEFQRLINIEQPILMGKYEITQRQFTQVMGLHKFSNIDMDKPADNISWHDANEFCQRLSKVTGETYRLPTEAEWTRAYTAGKHTQYPWGNSEEGWADYAWLDDDGDSRTRKVGLKKPNEWGLYDMAGNVSEWCADWYYEFNMDSLGKFEKEPEEKLRVMRGAASWLGAWNCRVTYRDGIEPGSHHSYYGFRVVKEIKEDAIEN